MADKKTKTEEAPKVEEAQLQTTDPNAVTDLAQLSDIAPAMERPSGLDPNDLAGTEDIGVDEVRLPRLGIAQGLSPQMIPTEGNYIKGLSMFEMFNDVTSAIYGNGPLVVVPVRRSVTRIEFDPNDRKVPLDREVPAGDPRTKWTKNAEGKGEPPRATEFVEFVCILLRRGFAPEPIVVSIKTTNKYQRNAAALWTTFIKLRNTAIYRGMYHITSKSEKGKTKEGQDTNFGVFVVKNAGFIPTATAAGQMLFTMAKNLHESLEGKTIVINRDDTPDEGDASFDTAAMDAQGTRQPTGTTDM